MTITATTGSAFDGGAWVEAMPLTAITIEWDCAAGHYDVSFPLGHELPTGYSMIIETATTSLDDAPSWVEDDCIESYTDVVVTLLEGDVVRDVEVLRGMEVEDDTDVLDYAMGSGFGIERGRWHTPLASLAFGLEAYLRH